jgi:hypothetical protein
MLVLVWTCSSKDSAVCIVSGLHAELPGFDSHQGQCLPSLLSYGYQGSFPWVKRLGREANQLYHHLEAMTGSVPSFPYMSAWHGVYLSSRDGFIYMGEQPEVTIMRAFVIRGFISISWASVYCTWQNFTACYYVPSVLLQVYQEMWCRW